MSETVLIICKCGYDNEKIFNAFPSNLYNVEPDSGNRRYTQKH